MSLRISRLLFFMPKDVACVGISVKALAIMRTIDCTLILLISLIVLSDVHIHLYRLARGLSKLHQ